MSQYIQNTPCPAPLFAYPPPHHAAYHPSTRTGVPYVDPYAPQYTTNLPQVDKPRTIEYTTELQAQYRNAKPRRKRPARQSTFDPDADIWQDTLEAPASKNMHDREAHKAERRRTSILPSPGNARRSTILAHPAQKAPPPPASRPLSDDSRTAQPQHHRRRVSSILADRQHALADNNIAPLLKQGELKKEPRRRTIYVPSDDTTVMTIHPGQPIHIQPSAPSRIPKSPRTGLELVTVSEEEGDELIPAIKREKKALRKSLAVAPKRVPLAMNKKPLQSVSFSEDVVGTGGGKENMPPGKAIRDSLKARQTSIVMGTVPKAPKVPANTSQAQRARAGEESRRRRETILEASHKRSASSSIAGASPAKATKAYRQSTVSALPQQLTPLKSRKAVIQVLSPSSPFRPMASPPAALRRQRRDRVPTKLSAPQVRTARSIATSGRFPVLSEDLRQPELYEDSWLACQETALTQLLNQIFESAKPSEYSYEPAFFSRGSMLDIYHAAEFPLLYKRLQASLLYGALSIPKELLAKATRLETDIGLRKKFVDLFLENYNLSVLKAAAEAVVGREITVPSRLSAGSVSSTSTSKKAIQNFLEAFLVRHEDACRARATAAVGSIANIAKGFDTTKSDDIGSQGWSWRRTVLRSLMLVLLLDRAKSNAGIMSECLFQTTSVYKRSADVLRALGTMLLPSIGDIIRPLGHLNYNVKTVQYPLEEFIYHVDNLAVDMRDGILLTRLVELLLYPTAKHASCTDEEETVTVTMPTGEVLTSSFDLTTERQNYVLSQHLKLPCISRAQKVYNVHIALSALRGIKGTTERIVQNYKAEDIVDGHREKTLSLLWALVSQCGLETLVQWKEVEQEIERLRHERARLPPGAHEEYDFDEEDADGMIGLKKHTHLLRTWARSIGCLHGLKVHNLTTSFADNAVLEAIVDTYLPYTPKATLSSSAASGRSRSKISSTSTVPTMSNGLPAKLRSIGCSTSFTTLFLPSPAPLNATSRVSTSLTTAPAIHIPSAQFTLSALSFLASRLLPATRAHRAAAVIQRAYRAHLQRRDISKRIAATRLAHHCALVVRTRERVIGAATTLQRAWRRVLDRRIESLVRDVTSVQSAVRGWKVRSGVKTRAIQTVRAGW